MMPRHKKRVRGRLYDSRRLSWSCQLECTRHFLVSHFFFFKSWFHWAITVGSCNGSLMLMRLYSWLTADSTREKEKRKRILIDEHVEWWVLYTNADDLLVNLVTFFAILQREAKDGNGTHNRAGMDTPASLFLYPAVITGSNRETAVYYYSGHSLH